MTRRSRMWIFLKIEGLPEMVCFAAVFTVLVCFGMAFILGIDSGFKKQIEWNLIILLALGLISIFSVFILIFYGKYIIDIIRNKPMCIEGKIIERSDIRVYVTRTLRTRKIGEKILIDDSEGKTVNINLMDNVLQEINNNIVLRKRVQYKKRYHYLPISKFVVDIEYIPVIRDNHYKLMKDKKYRREIKMWIEAPEYRE